MKFAQSHQCQRQLHICRVCPLVAYTLSRKEKQVFCQVLNGVKVPEGYMTRKTFCKDPCFSACVNLFNEPVLLVGETGTGKTTLVLLLRKICPLQLEREYQAMTGSSQ